MSSSISNEVEAGDIVTVEKRNIPMADPETGVVVSIGEQYSDTENCLQDDGILVKLQISNTKQTFPPSWVTKFVSSPSNTKRRRTLRGARITPSPVALPVAGAAFEDEEERISGEKRGRDTAANESTKSASKKSRYFEKTSDSTGTNDSMYIDERIAKEFEVGNDGETKIYFGRIDRMIRKDGGKLYWHVTYDDDDEEEVNENEVKSALSLYAKHRADDTEEQEEVAKSTSDDGKAKAVEEEKEAGSDNSSDSIKVEFRVQTAPSSASKCKECQESIRKKSLRLQSTSTKRGWYHAHCVTKKFDSVQAAEGMQGFEELSAKDQEKLRKGLSGTVDSNSDEEDDPPLANMRRPSAASQPNNQMIVASDSDSDDDKDMPFRVEYATTGRATCRGCDSRIQKKTMRICHKPLFRGKPGFTVYRHLECTILEENIVQLSDVGGWRKLSPQDQKRLEARIEESKELIKKENEELRPDELVHTSFQGEIRQSPPGLTGSLLPFQVEGTSWMHHQECKVPEIRGGIMADEMGMGKTLQTIVTILDNRPKLQHSKPGVKHPPSAPDLEDRKHEESLWVESLKSWNHEMEMCNVPKKILVSKKKAGTPPMGARAGTLVVCPVIALYQWQEEIKKFTEGNALTVGIYHGPNRAKTPREVLCKYDVVLTTYQILEADFRKMVSPNKVKCPNCGGSYKIDKLRVHLKYFCGETAQRTEAQSRQRRTAERRGDNAQASRGGGGRSSGGKGKKKSFSKATTKKKAAPTKNKTSVRVKRTADYDSDSELSVPDNLDITSARPSRAAAKTATKRLSVSAKQWGAGDKDDSDSASDGFASSSDDEESDSDVSVVKKKSTAKKAKVVVLSENDESSDSEDEAALARARKKQKVAMARAANGKMKGKQTSKKKALKGKGRKPPVKKGKGKKKFNDDSDGVSSDEDSDDDVAPNKETDPLEGIDLEALVQAAMAGSRASILHTMCWWRVVLDEAHFIKSRSSQTAAAAFALTSIHRWCLSGTPLQNRVGELYSLIRFLRIDPMAHYFCRKEGCGCKSIHYRMQHGKCQDCGHGSILHFSHFNKHVLNPIQRAGYQGDGRRAMMKLKNEVLDKSLIRRTKETKAEDMNLPPRVVTIKTVRLHPIEEDFYNGLYTETKNSFDDYVHEGTLLNNYAHIFDLLTKMRQAVDHPYLIVYSKKNSLKMLQANTPAVANGSVDCEICNEPPTDRVVSSCCGSAFCRSCVVDYMSPSLQDAQQHDSTRCPSCRDPFTIDLNQASSDIVDDGTLTISVASTNGSPTAAMPSLREMTHVSSGSILRRINLAEYATSTKIEALVQELVQMRQERSGSKALVFSQFVNMLDLARWRLHSDPCLADLGLGVRIIHGGMNVQSRDAALKDFREDSSVRVLLMSLKAGGVALNLTVANEVYLLDPWWNPAAEMQAIDRTHRLGQYRPIRAVRFIAEGTVEERVLQLQEKKRLVFDGTVGRDAASLKALSVDDMKALFT